MRLLDAWVVLTVAATLASPSWSIPTKLSVQEVLPQSRNVNPISYHVKITPDAKGTFSGHVEISMRCVNETDTLRVDARGDLSVSSTTLRCSEGTDIPVVKTTLEEGHLIIVLGERLQPSHVYQLTIDYQGSGLLHGDHEGDWFVASNIAPGNASVVFPCFDDPTLKTPFELSVARRDPSVVVANMPLRISEPISGSDLVWDHFEATPPVSPCSVGFVVSVMPFVTPSAATSSKVAIRLYARSSMLSQLQKAADAAGNILHILETRLGMELPLPKLDIMAIPGNDRVQLHSSIGFVMAMDQDFLTEYVNGGLLYLFMDQWLEHMTTPDSLIAEYAKEGLRQFLVSNIGDELFPEESELSLQSGSKTVYYALSDPVPFRGETTRNSWKNVQTAWFMQMVQRVMSPEKFMAGVRQLLQDRKYLTYSAHDVWTTLSAQVPDLGVSLEHMAKEWLPRNRAPFLTVTRNYDDNTATVEQRMFLRERPHSDPNKDTMTWTIPIMYVTPDNMDLDSIHTSAWMKNEKSITITGLPASDKFIIVNPAEIGMFMVKYDAKNWEMLQAALERNVSSIPVDIRRKLVHDAWNLGYAGELNWATVMNMTRFLHKELDPSVWQNLFIMMDHIGTHQIGTSSVSAKFAEYNKRLIAEAIPRIKAQASSEKYAHLLRRMEGTIATPDSTRPESYETETLPAYVKWMESDHPEKEVPLSLEGLCQVFQWGSMAQWEFGLQRFASTNQNWGDIERWGILRQVIFCPDTPEKIERLLHTAFLVDGAKIADSEAEYILSMMTGDFTKWSTLFNFLENNWNSLHERLLNKPDLWVSLVDCATVKFTTQEWYDKVSHLYEEHKTELGSAKTKLEEVLSQMREEVEWSNENLPVLEAWLDHELARENVV